jgi:hypothetical protein
MVEENETNHDSEDANNGHQNGEPSYLLWVFIAGGIAVVGLLAASIWWPNLTERTKFFTGNLLNLVIALAVIAQVLIYRKQWGAMKDAISRQDADLRQWVEIRPLGIRATTRSKAEQPSKVEITLRWKVLNQTRLPFTIEEIRTAICRDNDWEMFEMVETETIPPAGHDARNFYPFFIPLKLTNAETKRFLGDGLGLSIAIKIIWRDAIGRRQEQGFGDFYECGTDRMEIVEALGKHPTFIGVEDGGESTLVSEKVNVVADFKS